MTTQGTIADPMTLAEALQSPRIKPGHTLYLRGGTYKGDFVSTLVGVTVKPYQGERPIIDGTLIIRGSDSSYERLEVLNTGWVSRWSDVPGSAPPGVPVAGSGISAIDIFGPRTTVRDCVMHDTRQGLGMWVGAQGSVVEGCLMYNNGWDAPDRLHGPCLYCQNRDLPPMVIRNNCFASTYSTVALHAYTEGSYMHHFRFEGNIHNNLWSLFTGYLHGIDDIVCRDNVFYKNMFTLSNGGVVNGTCDVFDTLLLDGATMDHYGTFTRYTETGTSTQFGDRILERGRFVAVLNESNAPAVPITKPGRYINCLNPAESVLLTTSTLLPMDGWTVATPYAARAPIAQWDRRFALFLVEPSVMYANYMPMMVG